MAHIIDMASTSAIIHETLDDEWIDSLTHVTSPITRAPSLQLHSIGYGSTELLTELSKLVLVYCSQTVVKKF